MDSDLTIAASLFKNVFGHSAAVKALPALVAISAIGHLLGVAFTVCMYTHDCLSCSSNSSNERDLTARVLQELAKDGITPFPNILMQNRPFKTPIVCLAIHLVITIILICAPPAGDAFSFVVGLGTYPTVFLLTLVTIGLIKLRLDESDNFQSSFKVPRTILVFYLAGNIVSQVFLVPGMARLFANVISSSWLCPLFLQSMAKEALVFRIGFPLWCPWLS